MATGSARRHESIIPLSREHHYGLMLCLRIHRALPVHEKNESALRLKSEQVILFFGSELKPHFKAEEEILFPAMRELPMASGLITELLAEHRKLELLVAQLRQPGNDLLSGTLGEFADLLEAHIRKEERQLFPIYEEQASVELAESIGRRILSMIGPALRPRNAELLK